MFRAHTEAYATASPSSHNHENHNVVSHASSYSITDAEANTTANRGTHPQSHQGTNAQSDT